MNAAGKNGMVREWAVRGLSAGALVAGLWLAWGNLSGQVSGLAGCGGGGGCAEVLGGRWSEWLGVPVALLAAGVHGVVLGLSLTGRVERWRLLAAWLLVGAAVYFLTILYGVERRHCPWCLGLHGAGLAVAVLVLGGKPWRDVAGAFRWAVAGLAVLVAGQIWGPRPQTYLVSGPAVATVVERQEWSWLDGQLKLVPGSVPMIGKAGSKVVLVEFFDYTCGSCRDLAGDLKELGRKWPDQFSVVVLPAPLNRSCNTLLKPQVKDHAGACELARLALAVWRAKAESFPEFHDYLFTLPLPAGPEVIGLARGKAVSLAGDAALSAALADPWVEQRLKENVAVFGTLTQESVVMPKLLFPPAQVMHGTARDTAEFVRMMEERFGLGGR